jgi:alkylation response protein AidB-like acyl-CoA dehydrogenase
VDVVGNSELSQVFFHDLHVPVADRVGEENRGWYYVAQALNFERSGYGIGRHVGFIRRFFEKIVSLAKETKYRGEPLSKNPIVRNKLAKLEIEVEIASIYCYRTAWLLETKGQVPPVDASIAKVLVSEILVRVAVTGMEILGQYSQLRRDSKWAELGGIAQHFYLQSYAIKVGGGTNEIERDIIAQVGMGLPRSRR